MPIRRLVIALALALAFVPSAFSAQEHKHDGHSHSHELRLDNGKKWRTDAAQRHIHQYTAKRWNGRGGGAIALQITGSLWYTLPRNMGVK